MNREELKDCPFCGAGAYRTENKVHNPALEIFVTECETPCPNYMHVELDKERYVTAWNTRKSEDSL